MSEDESLKPLLERLCSIEEQQLAKLIAIDERQVAANERITKWMATAEENQKKARAYATGQAIGAWFRTGFIVFMLGLIAVAIIIAHYLK